MAARFQEKTQLQGVNTSTGAAQGLTSLADRLNQFKSIGSQALGAGLKIRAEEQTASGTATGSAIPIERVGGVTQKPKYKDEPTLFGVIEQKAHNIALRNSYKASIGNDIRTGIAELEANNKDDLIGFNEAINGFSKGMLQSVDPSVKDEVRMALDDRITTSRINVQNATIKKENDIAKATLDISSQNMLDEALRFSSNGDIRSAASGLIDYNKTIDSQVEAGFLSEGAAIEKKREAELRATHENLVGNIRRIANGGKTLDAVNIITEAQQKIPRGMSVEEHQELTSAMITELNEGINNKNRGELKASKISNEAQSTNYANLAIGVATGKADANMVIRNLKSGEITEPQFDKLLNTLNKRGQGVDSFQLINLIDTEIRQGGDLESTRNTIIANIGTNLTESTGQGLLDSLNEHQDKESILRTGNVTRARDFITPSIRVTGPLGALDQEAESRLAQSIRSFDTRVLEGEDPWSVADELVGKDKLERESNPMFGTKDNLDTSMEKLNTAFDTKQIDEATYNFEFEKIGRIKELKSNIDAFNISKKEADANRVK